MMSNITQDSGIHTMSSRRESAYSDSALPNLYHHSEGFQRRSSSDCITGNVLPNKFLGNGVDHITRRLENAEIAPHTPCNKVETPQPVFSRCESACDCHSRQYSCHQETSRVSHCSQRYSSDPGGGSCYRAQSNCCLSIHHTTCACLKRNYLNGHGENGYLQEHTRSNLPSVNTFPASKESPNATNRPVETHMKKSEQGITQISAKRLMPTRHQTKNAILSILESREVCIEFLKRRGPQKTEMVCEVCRISPDGLRIVLYQPEGGKGVPPSSTPPPLPASGTDQIYGFENLPEKLWKKYVYAAKFVDLVKAKTPKITYYTDKAKCLLMENLTDFEACFHEGKKYIFS